MGTELSFNCKAAGGSAVGAAVCLMDRAQELLLSTYAPDDIATSDDSPALSVAQVQVVLGDIDREEREIGDLPAVVVRPVAERRERRGGQMYRVITLQAAILVKVRVGADAAYAWNIWEILSLSLSQTPYLGKPDPAGNPGSGIGQYPIDAESLDCREDQALQDLYGCYALAGQLNIALPAWESLQGPDGSPSAWENEPFGMEA